MKCYLPCIFMTALHLFMTARLFSRHPLTGALHRLEYPVQRVREELLVGGVTHVQLREQSDGRLLELRVLRALLPCAVEDALYQISYITDDESFLSFNEREQ